MIEGLLKVNSKAYSKIYIFYSIIIILNIILFILVTLNFCQSFYRLDYMEEIYPDIDITGLNSFDFELSSDSYDYSPEMDNLGNTGKIYLDCYEGKCSYIDYDTCFDEDGSSYSCNSYSSEIEYSCSDNCRKNRDSSCSKNYCTNPPNGYSFDKSTCYRYNNEDDYSKPKSCYPDNLILNWKNYHYKRINATKYGTYSYLNSAVPSNETCPLGKKMCGILDDLGNKFCIPNNENCPINFISLNKSEIKHFSSYNYASVKDKIIYYTNLATETGKIVGGLFVDSDLMIKYNNEDCEILDTSTISDLLQHNYNKLYRKSLDFDIYEEDIDTIDKRGISYLKWCIPGYGKEKNIEKIKKLIDVYKYNITSNEESIKPIKLLFIISYFISLPGYIVLLIFLIILLNSFFYQNNIEPIIKLSCLKCENEENKMILIILFISNIFILTGSIISLINNVNLFPAKALNLDSNIIITLIILNIISFIINILMILFFIMLLIYLSKIPESGSNDINQNNDYNSMRKSINNDFPSQETSKGEDKRTEDEIRGGFTYDS